ncbi:MAG: acyl-CoA reductase-like NAD-dependent aldehyde dehydrogenase [Candidatus Poriferisodalaceae bacterium]|jgi:acyl-CoA reductase-like NAD-dependent aldehyde dehydrogenase
MSLSDAAALAGALRLAELALKAGLPDFVVNAVPGFGDTVGEHRAQTTWIDLS